MLKDRIGNEISDGQLALVDIGALPNKMLDGVITFTHTSDVFPNGQLPVKRVIVMVQIEIQTPGQMLPNGRIVFPERDSRLVVMPCPPNHPLAIALGLADVEKKKEKSALIT
jgi:hypothetical protein